MEATADEFECDPNYEYDAPKYFDFATLDGMSSPNVDSWFSRQATGEEGRSNQRTPLKQLKEDNCALSPAAKIICKDPVDAKLKSNIVTSWGTSRLEATTRKRGITEAETTDITAPEIKAGAHDQRKAQRIHVENNATRTAPRKEADAGMKRKVDIKKPAACHQCSTTSTMNRNKVTAKRSTSGKPESNLQRVLQPKKVLPVRSTKPLTLPEEVQLKTETRARGTNFKPPRVSPYKPLAVRVKEFMTKTPARFKSRPLPVDVAKAQVPKMTLPKEPVLWTSTRLRPRRFKSKDEEEAEVMARMPKFQARPLRSSNTDLQPPMPCVRSKAAAKKASHEKTTFFKAQPLKKSILEKPAFVPQLEHKPPTVPISPCLLTKQRHQEVKVEEEKFEFHARPLPNFSQVSIPHVPVKEATQPAPFQLRTEARGEVHRAVLQSKLEALKEEEEVVRIPRALGLPFTTDMPAIPPRPGPKPLTVPEPFQLESEARHEDFQRQLQEKLMQEEEERCRAAEFRARPMFDGKVFMPLPSDAPLTVPEPVALATEERAMEREDFDLAVKEKLAALEEERQQEEEERRQREEEEIKEYRKTLQFKARPVPDFS